MTTDDRYFWYRIVGYEIDRDWSSRKDCVGYLERLDKLTIQEIYSSSNESLATKKNELKYALENTRKVLRQQKNLLKDARIQNEQFALKLHGISPINESTPIDSSETSGAHASLISHWQKSLAEIRHLESRIESLTAAIPQLEKKMSVTSKVLSLTTNRPKFLGHIIASWSNAKIVFSLAHDKSNNFRRNAYQNAIELADRNDYLGAIQLLKHLSQNDLRVAQKHSDWQPHLVCLETLGKLAIAYEKTGMYYRALETAVSYQAILQSLSKQDAIKTNNEFAKQVTYAQKNCCLHIARLEKKLGRLNTSLATLAKADSENNEIASDEWFNSLSGNLLRQNLYAKPPWTLENYSRSYPTNSLPAP